LSCSTWASARRSLSVLTPSSSPSTAYMPSRAYLGSAVVRSADSSSSSQRAHTECEDAR
jgi:hypothetical protein